MVGGTIRRKVIHRESFRASVLHLSEIQAVLQSIAAKKSVLTTPSLLSKATQIGGRSKGWPTQAKLLDTMLRHLLHGEFLALLGAQKKDAALPATHRRDPHNSGGSPALRGQG